MVIESVSEPPLLIVYTRSKLKIIVLSSEGKANLIGWVAWCHAVTFPHNVHIRAVFIQPVLHSVMPQFRLCD